MNISEIEISIVVPIYESESNINNLVTKIINSVSPISISYEIILVDDCSKDNSWQIINTLVSRHEYIRGILLVQNSGQNSATMAGISQAKGNYILTIDDDLQFDPKYIKALYQKIKATHLELVVAAPLNSKHKKMYNFLKEVYILIIRKIFSIKEDDFYVFSSFRIYSRQFINNNINWYHPYKLWLHNFDYCSSIKINHDKSQLKESRYSFIKYFNFFLSALLIILYCFYKKYRFLIVISIITIVLLVIATSKFYTFVWLAILYALAKIMLLKLLKIDFKIAKQI